jgi:hypothetical protein
MEARSFYEDKLMSCIPSNPDLMYNIFGKTIWPYWLVGIQSVAHFHSNGKKWIPVWSLWVRPELGQVLFRHDCLLGALRAVSLTGAQVTTPGQYLFYGHHFEQFAVYGVDDCVDAYGPEPFGEERWRRRDAVADTVLSRPPKTCRKKCKRCSTTKHIDDDDDDDDSGEMWNLAASPRELV